MFKGAIFDLDGLMIDSEPLWREVLSAVFTARGVPVSVADCAQTMGLRVDEVIRYWDCRYPQARLDLAATEEEIVAGVLQLIATRGEPLPGVLEAIELMRSLGCRLAVASSSSMRIITAALGRFEMLDAFDALCSAEREARGKPAPDVYLSAVAKLGIQAGEGIAFEDSRNGVSSAVAAGLVCVCVPDRLADRAGLDAELVLNSLTELTAEVVRSLADRIKVGKRTPR